jgi:hypothetical protein
MIRHPFHPSEVCECPTCEAEFNVAGYDTVYHDLAYNSESRVFLELNLSKLTLTHLDAPPVPLDEDVNDPIDFDGDCAEAGHVFLHMANHKPWIDLRTDDEVWGDR